jgi:C1A family cysteine protease
MFKKLFLIVTLCANLGTNVVADVPAHAKNYAMVFANWMQTHGFDFAEHEYLHRLKTFIENDKFIDFENGKNLSYTLGHNKFSHMDSDEFSKTILCGNMKQSKNLRGVSNVVDYTDADVEALPTSVDWRTKNVVSSICDQGQCGSCYAFSTVSTIESAYAIKYGTLQKYSEQEVVDCSGPLNLGCNGGTIDGTFRWVKNNGGLCLESDYPYTSGISKTASTCQKSCKSYPKSDVVSWTDVKENDKNALMVAVAQQPISIAIQADQKAFQMYSSGIFSASCGTELDHAVVVIGYSSSGTEPYWLVRNSWGSWGENGYIRLAMNIDQKEGQCGLYMTPSYPSF